MSLDISLRNPGVKFNIVLWQETEKGYTPYLTFIYDDSRLKLMKNSGQYGACSGMVANSANPTTWFIGKIQKSSNVFHPVVNVTSWRWLSGNTTLI